VSDDSPTRSRRPAEQPTLYLRLLGLFAMQPGEVPRALLTFAYLFLIIAAYVMLKAVRNALFISEFGAMKLPYVMIGIALLAGLFAAVYVRLARRRKTPSLVFWTLLFFASNVLVFWWLAVQGFPWLYPLLYLWSGVFGVLGTTQVWTVASELFTTREAKRLFGVVGSGGILGAVAGSALTNRLAPVVGTAHLLLIVLGMLILAAFAVRVLSRLRMVPRPVAEGRTPPRNLTQSLQLIAGSSHLRLLAGLIFITAVATTSVDFQFNVVAEQSIPERDALTAFFGAVYGGISLLSFLVQILLTSRLLASVGVGFSILLLPLSLATGTIALFVSGALWAGVFLKGSDGALKHSLDRSCRELMYLPVPSAVRAQAKSTIDTVMDRLGDGSAGVLQLLITAGLGLGLGASLAANFLLVGIWLFLALRLRNAYVNQLCISLRRARRAPEELPAEGDADTRRAMEGILREGSEPEKLAALEWIGRNRVPVDEKLLLDLARQPDAPAVHNAALGLLLTVEHSELPPELSEQLEKEGQAVLVAAIDLLVEEEPQRLQERLEKLLDQAGETTRLSVVAFMLRRLGPEFEPFARQVFDALLAPTAPAEARAAAVRALALLPPDSGLLEHLDAAIVDSDAVVAAAAAETAGRLGRADLIPRMISLLDWPALRLSVRRGLTHFGERAVPVLLHSLESGGTPASVRRHIPRLLGQICTPRSVEALVAALDDQDAWVRQGSLEALRSIRRRLPEIRPLRGHRLQARIFDQVSAYEDLLSVEEALRNDPDVDGQGLAWLVDALESERFTILERMFMLLALELPVADMARSWFAVRGGSPRERANAVELLDNLLPKGVKSRLLGLLEPAGNRVAQNWKRRHGRLSRGEALRRLIEGADPWIAACALYAARRTSAGGLEDAALRAAGSDHAVLREEAELFLAASGGETGA
jgi:ATP/ADP translocase